MGIIFFLDNYFSVLAAGVSNRAIADKNKMSREMFAFTINSVACATCVLVPLSLRGIFMGGQVEMVLGLEEGEGLAEIVKALPFILFAWVMLIFVLLYQFRIVKPFGNMKKAELRAESEGKLLPEDLMGKDDDHEEQETTSIRNFLIPMIALIAVTLFTKELLYGLLVGVVLCYILYIPQKLIKAGEAFDAIFRGFEEMFVVTAIVISAFVLLMLPLAESLDANMYMTIGAVIAGAASGSTTCFYGDSVTLSCSISKIRNNDFLRTGLPMVVPPIIVTIILYLVLGFIL